SSLLSALCPPHFTPCLPLSARERTPFPRRAPWRMVGSEAPARRGRHGLPREDAMSEQEGAPAAPQQGAQQTTEVHVDDSGTLPSYSNFCRVTATPEEVILDFGLNPQ